jgi:hypothetical protein
MNIHEALDNLTVALSALALGKSRFFDRSIQSPTYGEQLERVVLTFPELSGEGQYEVRADTPAGELTPALHVVQWKGKAQPTIIYHHGGLERPFDYGHFSKNTFKSILFSHRHLIRANLVNLRAGFHESIGGLTRVRCFHYLEDFVTMLCVSVKLLEGVVSRARAWGSEPVLASGISLGGWIVNLHRAYFNSADVYVPMLAGAALGDVFVRSAYRMMSGRPVRDNPETVRNLLNFEEEYARVTVDNVFPLLALYDRIIEFERQKKCYGSAPVRVLRKGHASCARAQAELRRHILGRL